MKILIIISTLDFGGAQKQVVEDVNMLSQNNKVFLLSFEPGPLQMQVDKSIPVSILKRTRYLTTARKIASIIRINQISIVHAHLYAPMVIAAIAGRITGVPIIWNFHSHSYEKSFKARILHKFAASLSSVKAILFPATELKQYYEVEGYGFPRQKCRISYNSGQKIDQNPKRDIRNINEIIKIGFIGRIIPLKRVHLLVELADFLLSKDYEKFKIAVVGDGPELETLMLAVKNRNLESFITFHGFKEDTAFYYRQFDVFAFPSREEVLSLSLIDAGMNGLASVAFDVGGNHEIISNAHTGFLVDSQEQFFEKIFELIQNDKLRKQLGDNAREECFLKFSPSARLEFLKKLYAELL